MYHSEIGEVVPKCQIDMDVEEDEVDWDKILVKQEVNPQKHESLCKATDSKLKKLRQLPSASEKYKKYKQMALDEEGSGAEEENAIIEIIRNKKRKVLKAFRSSNGVGSTRRKFGRRLDSQDDGRAWLF
jgi:predicted RNA-binding protein